MEEIEAGEVLTRSARMIGPTPLKELALRELCELISVAQYVADLALKELEERGELQFADGVPCVPHLIPEDMVVRTAVFMAQDFH